MNITWNKCQGEVWGHLNRVDLSHGHFDRMEGVYVIWHGGPDPKTVRVGQGIIKDRLAAHRNDPDIQAHSAKELFVTWAAVAASARDGVEAFLAEALKPLVGDRFPDVAPVAVNLPWA